MRIDRALMSSALALFIACGPTERPVEEPEPIGDTSPSVPTFSAVVILSGLGFATEIDPQTRQVKRWGPPLMLMEKVSPLGEEAELTVGNAKRAYVKVRRQTGEEGWANAAYVIPDAYPGVILTQRATFYRQPDLAGPDTTYLVRGDFVAVLAEPVINNFVKVVWANPNTSAVVTGRYLKADTLTTAQSDLDAALLYALALRETNLVKREELLNNAASIPSEAFRAEIQTELRIARAGFQVEAVRPTTEYLVTLDTEVLEAPFPDAAPIAPLRANQKVNVRRKLVQGDVVWFEVLEPRGYVDSGFLFGP